MLEEKENFLLPQSSLEKCCSSEKSLQRKLYSFSPLSHTIKLDSLFLYKLNCPYTYISLSNASVSVPIQHSSMF